MEIQKNLLLFNQKSELNKKTTKFFYDRLKLILKIDYPTIQPGIIITDNIRILKTNDYSAMYDMLSNRIIMNASSYNTKLPTFKYKNSGIIPDSINSYNYIVPVSDIYHEMIHHIQNLHGSDDYDVTVEASAELLSYILTIQDNIEYKKEAVAFWHTCKYILKLTNIEFFVLISNTISDASYIKKYLLNKPFLDTLNKEYNNDTKAFFTNMVKNYGNLKHFDKMLKDLNKLAFLLSL